MAHMLPFPDGTSISTGRPQRIETFFSTETAHMPREDSSPSQKKDPENPRMISLSGIP